MAGETIDGASRRSWTDLIANTRWRSRPPAAVGRDVRGRPPLSRPAVLGTANGNTEGCVPAMPPCAICEKADR